MTLCAPIQNGLGVQHSRFPDDVSDSHEFVRSRMLKRDLCTGRARGKVLREGPDPVWFLFMVHLSFTSTCLCTYRLVDYFLRVYCPLLPYLGPLEYAVRLRKIMYFCCLLPQTHFNLFDGFLVLSQDDCQYLSVKVHF